MPFMFGSLAAIALAFEGKFDAGFGIVFLMAAISFWLSRHKVACLAALALFAACRLLLYLALELLRS